MGAWGRFERDYLKRGLAGSPVIAVLANHMNFLILSYAVLLSVHQAKFLTQQKKPHAPA